MAEYATGHDVLQVPAVNALVLGFGPFGEVVDNPSAALALALSGRRVSGVDIIGEAMPVSYGRSVTLAMVRAAQLRPALVLGIGVAMRREVAMVERYGRNRAATRAADVDGVRVGKHGEGPAVLESPLAEELARALGVHLSSDAGTYVCNAWLYRSLRCGLPAAFLHVPAHGIEADRVAEAVARVVKNLEHRAAR